MASRNENTHLQTLLSATHGRQRRVEREIDKIDLQRARKYGMCESAKKGKLKYTYGGIVFIYDQYRKREITTFRSSDQSSIESGTKCTVPIILEKKDLSASEVYEVKTVYENVILNKALWRSHNVMVIDMSGSMRRDDINGARCRSDGVWMAIAKDFLMDQLTQKTLSSMDLISIILMRDEAQLVIEHFPCSWILYNLLIDYREWTKERPRCVFAFQHLFRCCFCFFISLTLLLHLGGAGNYMPALKMAEELLDRNTLGSCALSLMFFSDGKPSDRGNFAAKIGQMAAKFRRRLSISCVGMAHNNEDFSTLEAMIKEAKAYGSIATFNRPSLSIDSLSCIFTSLASSLTSTKTEMTDVRTGKAKLVRTDVRFERLGVPEDDSLNQEWTVFKGNTQTNCVIAFWTWNHKLQDFVRVLDYRCQQCFQQCATREQGEDGTLAFGAQVWGEFCTACKVCMFCFSCRKDGALRTHANGSCFDWHHLDRKGKIAKREVPSFYVAMKEPIFGEGAERSVHRFRFLDPGMNFVGKKYVAKESRFVEKEGSNKRRLAFHRGFARTQSIASDFATQFNLRLDSSKDHFTGPAHAILDRIPRIFFLDPMIVEAFDKDANPYDILIEPQLDGSYEKFNNNMGMVKNQAGTVAEAELKKLGNSNIHKHPNPFLGAIEEGSEEEDSDDEFYRPAEDQAPDQGSYENLRKDEDIPQAFSHFTFQRSNGAFLVVDLQGQFEDHNENDKKYVLTDPVIHCRNRTKKREKNDKFDFGRTDRGEDGMKAFFLTHRCSDMCRLLGLTPVSADSLHSI